MAIFIRNPSLSLSSGPCISENRQLRDALAFDRQFTAAEAVSTEAVKGTFDPPVLLGRSVYRVDFSRCGLGYGG